jgi:hypothetical protein
MIIIACTKITFENILERFIVNILKSFLQSYLLTMQELNGN